MGSISGEVAMQGPTGGEERIRVSVRVRPLNDKELAKNDLSEWECINDSTIKYKSNLSLSDRSLYPTKYTFDRVFRADCPTRQVYEEAAKEVALSVLKGINSSIFAYGQTSSGKTYTMGGITEYTVADIFKYIEKHQEREFVMKFSAMEIYNESVRDLLSTDSTPLRLLDDPEKGTVVERLTEETLRDWKHFRQLISFSETQRQIGETAMNEVSSRSHQILRLIIESSARELLGNYKSLSASVNLVDLAGSERASQTNSAGTRLKEGCHINKSLLALGTVIRKLSKGRNGHIPFRDSKLTRILQSSIGGNARTAIICTMSPARTHVEQSRNTLLFASCAKEVATNAKVNVVISDKLLVKQLQRELARLESELKASALLKPKSAELLREKDLQIEMLKKEIMDLTLQRDLAQSHIKDMMVRDDISLSGLESPGPQYPKLRVRSMDDRLEDPDLLLSFDDLEESLRSFDAYQYSDGHSFSSEENYFQLPDLEKSLPIRRYSAGMSVISHDDAVSNSGQNMVQEQHDDNLGGCCKVVGCIESEDLITGTYTHSNPATLSPNLYADSNASSQGADTSVSGLTEVDNIDKENLDLCSSGSKESKELNSFSQGCVLPSSDKISPWRPESSTPRPRTVKLSRSRSCKASLMKDLTSESDWFDEEEVIQNTPPIDIGKEPQGFQRKTYTPNHNVNAERSSWSCYENSVGSAFADAQSLKSSFDMDIDGDGDLSPVRKERKDLASPNLPANREVLETGLDSSVSVKKHTDVGVDTKQSDEEKQFHWSLEFKRLQREIIDLWHACDVPLFHRTYFFLLFKGEPADSIYMEVELRRLSYLKKTFSEGNQTVEDGRTLTPESNKRYLRRERQMLSRQMHRKLSRSERENLYLKWGIRMSSKHRRLQLAHRLWSETDVTHIRESATIVAKLIGSVEPDQAFKEMFGLNFAPRHSRRKKSFGWTSSVRHLLLE